MSVALIDYYVLVPKTCGCLPIKTKNQKQINASGFYLNLI
ncbi:hypothetical protein M23134_04171 [Microscilla marina ATCC 23134]|uniref:Uncharacterized protein n=1 Tax=Microscilla marina ATCC 23134 TaxID=313606 RepID=A1ZE30_MICM2|nr:hypothetical protein M23134_04171 [Microscilla marina ATCC 23134]